MGLYTDRWLKFKIETQWGQWNTPDTFPNYMTEWSATTTENKSEEDIIAGTRDMRKRTWLEEAVVGRWVQELVSAKPFHLCLGKHKTSNTVAPFSHTFVTTSTLPSLSIYRGLYPDEAGNTISLGYMGMKVDTWELTIERGAEVRLEMNFAGKQATIPTQLPKSIPNFRYEAFSFVHSTISWTYSGGVLPLQNVARIVISGNHNLDAVLSAGARTYRCTEIREGPIEITGRITPFGRLDRFATDILNREEGTLTVRLVKSDSTVTITLNNVAFGELPDEMTGLEPVEIELPFVCRPVTGYDAIKVVEKCSYGYSTIPF